MYVVSLAFIQIRGKINITYLWGKNLIKDIVQEAQRPKLYTNKGVLKVLDVIMVD